MSKYKEIKKKFKKNGFVVLKNFIPKKIIDETKKGTEKLIKQGSINNRM